MIPAAKFLLYTYCLLELKSDCDAEYIAHDVKRSDYAEYWMKEGKMNLEVTHWFIHSFTKHVLGIISSDTRKFIFKRLLCFWPETVMLIRSDDYISSPGNPISYSEVKV